MHDGLVVSLLDFSSVVCWFRFKAQSNYHYFFSFNKKLVHIVSQSPRCIKSVLVTYNVMQGGGGGEATLNGLEKSLTNFYLFTCSSQNI